MYKDTGFVINSRNSLLYAFKLTGEKSRYISIVIISRQLRNTQILDNSAFFAFRF